MPKTLLESTSLDVLNIYNNSMIFTLKAAAFLKGKAVTQFSSSSLFQNVSKVNVSETEL